MFSVTVIFYFYFVCKFGNVQGYRSEANVRLENLIHRVLSRSSCSSPSDCQSKWGYCGTGSDYCGDGCRGGPCWGNNNPSGGRGGGSVGVIDSNAFACVFNSIDSSARTKQFDALTASGWTPNNKDEAAVFLAHVYHETDGLKTMREYCSPGCGPQYSSSWCSINAAPGKYYYGRGWFQLSYPCNYYNAGQSLGVNLLSNPDLVATNLKIAVQTAVWFFKANNMEGPARRGNFAATTRILNPIECNGGSGYQNQLTRVATYRRVRQCFNLGSPTINPIC
ncbi:unnamed protein product [Rotaria magnacalcarata]|uniref:Chitin-binding type-1 domain-containing protein n=2 Tax=Rotaria magnacalcarata TaxID=392030 RepID=A0A814XX51_9BILA|nr:unnamed protein product [Rotaria magnacalcarata]